MAPTDALPPATALGPADVVLVAEDNNSVRKLLCLLLEQQGLQVIEACDGPEALTAAGQHEGEIILLITDVGMPSMTGPQLAQQLKTHRPAVKVLYLTGDAEDPDQPERESAPTLHKPFTLEQLAEKIREALER